MTPTRILGAILVCVGILVLGYGGFSYTKETHKAELGPFKLSVEERDRVNIHPWVGIGSIAIGVVLLVLGGKKK